MYVHTSIFHKNMQNLSLFFFSWDDECVPGKIKANLQSKIIDTNKRDKHSSKLIPKSLQLEGRDVVVKIARLWCSVYHYCMTSFNQAWTKPGSLQFQILLPACQKFAMVRISDNLSRLEIKVKHPSLINHTTKTIHYQRELSF